MIKTRILYFFFAFILFVADAQAQSFNDFRKQEQILALLQQRSCAEFPDAKADVLYERGALSLNSRALIGYDYEIVFKVFDASDIEDLAVFKFENHQSNVIKKFSSVTYNLDESGKIVTAELGEDKLVKEISDMDRAIFKADLPAIKNGSVVALKLTIDGGIKPKWFFQRNYPVRYSRFDFTAQETFYITEMLHTAVPFTRFKTRKEMEKSSGDAVSAEESMLTSHRASGNIIARSWVRRNVPPFEEEPLSNYPNRVKEKLEIVFNNVYASALKGTHQEFLDATSKAYFIETGLREDAYTVGKVAKDIVRPIIASTTDSMEMLKTIFSHVQDNYAWKKTMVSFVKFLNDKQGSMRHINSLLCQSFRAAGFDAFIVLGADKQEGQAIPMMKDLSALDLVFVAVMYNNTLYFADASQKDLPFGSLPVYFYNGFALLINEKNGVELNLTPDLAVNNTSVSVSISPIEGKAGKCTFEYTHRYGAYDAVSARKKWHQDSIALHNEYKTQFFSGSDGLTVNDVSVENLNDLNKTMELRLRGELDLSDLSILSLNAFMMKVFTANPLGETAKQRKNDIEFKKKSRTTYTLTCKLPSGFSVADVPKGTSLILGETPTLKFHLGAQYVESINTATVRYVYTEEPGTLEANLAPDVRAFYEELIKSLNQYLVIKKI